jgi:hypothetical protein
MSKKVAPRVQFNFEPDVVIEPERVDNDLLIQNSDNINEDYDSLQMPEVIEKEQIVEDNIFESIKSKKHKDLEISEINEINEINEPVVPVPEVKKVQSPKPQKKKRVLSQDHKAKLALAREKALATRRAKAEEKKRMKQIENETKVLRKKKAEKDLEDLKSNVNNEKPVPTTSQSTAPVQTFTKEDLENAQLSAIIQYETIRKARKEEKKKEKMIQEQKEQMKRQIARYGAKDTNGRLLNRWDACY